MEDSFHHYGQDHTHSESDPSLESRPNHTPTFGASRLKDGGVGNQGYPWNGYPPRSRDHEEILTCVARLSAQLQQVQLRIDEIARRVEVIHRW